MTRRCARRGATKNLGPRGTFPASKRLRPPAQALRRTRRYPYSYFFARRSQRARRLGTRSFCQEPAGSWLETCTRHKFWSDHRRMEFVRLLGGRFGILRSDTQRRATNRLPNRSNDLPRVSRAALRFGPWTNHSDADDSRLYYKAFARPKPACHKSFVSPGYKEIDQ
jgi:hypothetical protein